MARGPNGAEQGQQMSLRPNSQSAKHPDCEDRCQLREHKGYISCSLTGCCAFAEDLSGALPDLTDDELDEQERRCGKD